MVRTKQTRLQLSLCLKVVSKQHSSPKHARWIGSQILRTARACGEIAGNARALHNQKRAMWAGSHVLTNARMWWARHTRAYTQSRQKARTEGIGQAHSAYELGAQLGDRRKDAQQ